MGTIAYRSALPPGMSGVHEVIHVSMLRKYTPDLTHIGDWGEIDVDTNETFEEGSVRSMDRRDQVLRRKTMRLVKVLWQHRGGRRQRENTRTQYRPPIPSCLGTKVRGLVVY